MQYLRCNYLINNTAMMGMNLLVCSLKQPDKYLEQKLISFDGEQFSLKGDAIP